MNRPTRNTLFGCVLCLILAVIYGCSAKAGFDSGNDVYLQCITPGRDYQLMCISKSVAYLDTMLALGYWCSKGDGVTGQQVRDILVKYLGDHPAIRNQSAGTLAVIAYSGALMCKPPGPAH